MNHISNNLIIINTNSLCSIKCDYQYREKTLIFLRLFLPLLLYIELKIIMIK